MSVDAEIAVARPRGAFASVFLAGDAVRSRFRLENIRWSRFLRHVALLMTGTFVAQLITAATTLVLAAMFDPLEFGTFALFAAVGAILFNIAGLKYEVAIPLAANERDAASLTVLCVLTSALLGAVVALVVWWFGDGIASMLGNPALAPLLPLLSPLVLASGCLQAWLFLLTRWQQYTPQAVSSVVRAVVTAIVQIGAGLMQFGAAGLALGQVIGMAVGAATLSTAGDRRWWQRLGHVVRRPRLLAAARRHRSMPTFMAPRALLLAVNNHLPAILLGALFTPASAAVYWVAVRLLDGPMQLMSRSLRRVFFGEAVGSGNSIRAAYTLKMRVTATLALLGAGPVVIVFVFGEALFQLLLGEKWSAAGDFARWLAIMYYAQLVAIPASTLAPVLSLEGPLLVMEIVALGLRVGAVLLIAPTGTPAFAVAVVSLIGVLHQVAIFLVVTSRSRRHRHPVPATASEKTCS